MQAPHWHIVVALELVSVMIEIQKVPARSRSDLHEYGEFI